MSYPESFFTPFSESYTSSSGGQLVLSKPISTFPGITPESTHALEEALQKNYEKFHVFFDPATGFHKYVHPVSEPPSHLNAHHGLLSSHSHLAHHVICSWALGSKSEDIEQLYEANVKYEIPLVVSPEPITEKNFAAHVGDDKSVHPFPSFVPIDVDIDVDVDFRFYQAFRDFFILEVDKHGVEATIDNWVVGLAGNTTRGNADKKNPQMLARLLSLLMHGLIHLGYGLEFGLPVMVIEGMPFIKHLYNALLKMIVLSIGLASIAVHQTDMASAIPESLFISTPEESGVFQHLISSVHSSLSLSPPSVTPSTTDVHALTIISRMLHDSTFSESQPITNFDAVYDNLARGAEIVPYVDMWAFDASDLGLVQRKIQELHWAATLIFASGRKGAKENDPFWSDFVTYVELYSVERLTR